MPLSIRLPPEIEERLERLAADTGRTKAFYIRELIVAGLEEAEQHYRALPGLRRRDGRHPATRTRGRATR